MRAEHFRIILNDGIGFTLPNGIPPSLVVGKIIVAVLINNHITQFTVNNVSSSFPCLYCIGHKWSAYKQIICSCTECFDGPVACIPSQTFGSIFFDIGLETLLSHFFSRFFAYNLCCKFGTSFGERGQSVKSSTCQYEIQHEGRHIACHYTCSVPKICISAVSFLCLLLLMDCAHHCIMRFTFTLCGIFFFQFIGIHHRKCITHIAHTEIPRAHITHSATETTPKAYIYTVFTVFLFFKVLNQFLCFTNGYG